MTWTRFISSKVVAIVVSAYALGAKAQVDSAGARLLFDEARVLAKQGKYEAACPKFEQSYQRERGLGTLFNLADCWEQVGRTASAWAKFRDVADEAARTKQQEREEVALQRANALLPRLSRLTVSAKGAEDGLEVRRDGVLLDSSELGRPVPLDPGEHVLEATAPGKQRWKSTVNVPPNAQTIEVVVPVLVDVNAVSRVSVTGDAVAERDRNLRAPASSPADGPTSDHGTSGSGQKTLAYVSAGVGLAGISIGGIYGLRVRSKVDESEKICPSGKECSPMDLSDYNSLAAEAKSARTVSYVGLGVGGAALVTAVVLYLTAPSTPSASAWHVVPVMGEHQVGGVVQGAF